MNKSKTKIYCLFAVSLMLALFGAVSFFLCFTGEFDADIGHFERDSVFSPVMYACIAIGAVCGIAAWGLFFRCEVGESSTVGNALMHTVIGILCAAAIFAVTAVDLVSFYQNPPAWDGVPAAMHGILWVVGLLSGIGMAIFSLPKYFSPSVRALAGFAAPLFLAAKVMILYFNKIVAVNSPAKLFPQLAVICFMLVLTAEVGINVGRGYILPRWIFMLCVSTAVGGAVGIGMLIVFVSGNTLPGSSIFDALLLTALFARSAVKLFFARDAEIRQSEKKKQKSVTD